jgi:ATP synthase protein I
MSNEPELPPQPPETDFSREVAQQEARKLKAQKKSARGVWLGLGMMGLVGWSVTVPTLAGTALGMWLDKHYTGGHSWTLALLVAGLCLGCANAWHWIAKEDAAIHKEEDEDDE